MAKAEAPAPLRSGDVIANRYRIARELGRGGMGVVYLCDDSVSTDRVAVKCVFLDRTRQFPNEAIWFQQEARALAALDHPTIVHARDFGTLADGSPYLAMDALHGRSIHVWKYLGKIPFAAVWTIIDQVLAGLAHAHARGIIHGDLKPSNVMVDPRGGLEEPRAYILDLGLAWLLSDLVDPRLEEAAPAAPAMPFGLGTPGWMAPEQIRRAAPHIGPATDLYAMGSILFELLTGREVFTGTSQDILRQHRDSPVPEIELAAGVPSGAAEFVRRCLAKRPWHRYRLAADARAAWNELRPLGDLRWNAPNVRIGSEDQDPALVSLRPTPSSNAANLSLTPGILSLRPTPLVGRQRERDALWERVQRVARGDDKQHLVVLRGEAGVGKSRIAEWMYEAVHESGSMVPLRARYRRTPGPFDGMRGAITRHYNLRGVARDVIEQALLNEWEVDPGDEQSRTWVAAAAAWLRPLTPDEEARVGPSGKRFFLDKPELRWVVIRHVLERIAATGRPLMLWLDDLHLASANAFAGLAALHRETQSLPMLMLATAREEALMADATASTRLTSLSATIPSTTLILPRLPESETRELLRASLPLAPEAETAAMERSQGNPLFALQLVHAWASGGHLSLDGTSYRVPERALRGRAKTTAELWDERLESIEVELRPAAYAAAALGEIVSVDGLTTLLASLGMDAPRAMRALGQSQILLTERAGRIRWPHGLLQEHMLARLGASPDAKRVFRLAADALGAHPESYTRRIVRQRVRNLILAGEDEAGCTLMLEFVERAWLRARDVPATRTDLTLLEGHLGPTSHPRALRWRAEVERHLGNLGEARALAEEARKRLGDMGAESEEGHCLRLLAHIASDQGVPALGRIEAVLAKAKFELIGDDHGRAQCELLLGEIEYLLGDHAGARTNLGNAARALKKVGDTLGVAQCLILLSFVEGAVGRLAAARDLLVSARVEFDAIGYQLGIAQTLVALAHVDHRAGDLSAAYDRTLDTRARFRSVDNPRGEAACERLMAMAALDRLDPQSAFHHALAAYAIYDQRLADSWGRVEGSVLLAQIALAEGATARAREHLEVARAIEIDESEPIQHRYLTEAWLALVEGDADSASRAIFAARGAFPDGRRTGDHTPMLITRLAGISHDPKVSTALADWERYLASAPSMTTPIPPPP